MSGVSRNSVAQTMIGLAVTASSVFLMANRIEAQAHSFVAQKHSLHEVAKENFGKKKNIPAQRLFSTSDSIKPYNADQHINLLTKYDYCFLPQAKCYDVAFNKQTGKNDTLLMGMTVWDHKNGYKGVFTYDPKNDVIDIHNSGMDIKGKNEWRMSAQAIFGFSLPGSKVAIDYAEEGFEEMQHRFPQVTKEKTALRFMGYSCGGPIAMMGAFGMALKGYKIDQVVLIDPYAAIYAIRDVKRLVKGHDNKKALNDFIDQRCMTMTPIGGSFVNKIPPFGLLAKDFGRVEHVDAGAKGEHHFLNHYHGKYTPYKALGVL